MNAPAGSFITFITPSLTAVIPPEIPSPIFVIPLDIVSLGTRPNVKPDRRPETLSLAIEPAVAVSFFASSRPARTASNIPNAAVATRPTPGSAFKAPFATVPIPLEAPDANRPAAPAPPVKPLPPVLRSTPFASLLVPVAMSIRLVPRLENAPIILPKPRFNPENTFLPFMRLV